MKKTGLFFRDPVVYSLICPGWSWRDLLLQLVRFLLILLLIEIIFRLI